MIPCHRTIVTVILAALLPLVALAELTDEQRAEQQELLAWVRPLELQARTDDALELCAMILATDPDCAEALVARGIILLGDGGREEARESFDQALRVQSRLAMALVGRGHAWHALGNVDRANGDAARAVEICTRAVDADPTDAEAYYVRGLARLLLQQDGDALQDFVTAADLDETLVEALVERAPI